MKLTLVKLLAYFPPSGLAWLPVGLFGFTDEDPPRTFADFEVGGDPGDVNVETWRQRVEGGLAAGTPPRELVDAWKETCNDITWSLSEETVELEPGEDPAERFKGEAWALLAERQQGLAEAEGMGLL